MIGVLRTGAMILIELSMPLQAITKTLTHCRIKLTWIEGVWLQTIHHIVVGMNNVDNFARSLVPYKRVSVVAPAHNVLISIKIALFYLYSLKIGYFTTNHCSRVVVPSVVSNIIWDKHVIQVAPQSVVLVPTQCLKFLLSIKSTGKAGTRHFERTEGCSCFQISPTLKVLSRHPN